MASQISDQEPEFITYLFSKKPKHDCYFTVGNKDLVNPERIGAVKLMLMAHSEVMRSLLEDSPLAEKNDITISDIYPDTFKTMLKYVYGYDTTAVMSFEEADSMLYVAEKYMINELKDKVAVRLMSLLNPDNLITLLNNPACYTHLELNSAITEIIQYETDLVLSSPQFLTISVELFARILEQEGLAVTEIELWRAAMKWAKDKAGTDDGKTLRQQISKITQHMRVCCLTPEDICSEVIPTEVLTINEVKLVCLSTKNQQKQDELTTFCNEIEPRKKLLSRMKRRSEISFSYFEYGKKYSESSLMILTKQSSIELFPLELQGVKPPDDLTPKRATYTVDCTVTLTRITDYVNGTSTEPPVTVRFSENVEYDKQVKIPLTIDGANVLLLPDNKYNLKIKFTSSYPYYESGSNLFENDDLKVKMLSHRSSNYNSTYYYHMNCLVYNELSPRKT